MHYSEKMPMIRWIVIYCSLMAFEGCMDFNQGLDQALSDKPMVCKDGIKYLPYTNDRDAAYTSEGRPETCPKDL
jgi:hypothetical protein